VHTFMCQLSDNEGHIVAHYDIVARLSEVSLGLHVHKLTYRPRASNISEDHQVN